MQEYLMLINSDQGKHRIVIHATDEAAAKLQAMAFLGCPERAILKINDKEIKTEGK